jgi:immune inhibitor A
MLQPDGTILTISQTGDENHHWTITTDGVLVVHEGDGYYIAQIDAHGTLSSSRQLAHEPALRSMEEQQLVLQQAERRILFDQYGEQQRRVPQIAESGYLPHSGNPRVLVILASYQDVDFTVNNPEQAFDQYLNGDEQKDLGNHNQMNYSCVRKYFETSSNGLFSPQFDVVGPVKLPQNMAYYGKDEKFSEMCKDATNLVKETTDWQRYDNDGDGRAELVYIIFAGYGENQGGSADAMWAKTSYLNIPVSETCQVTRFCCCSELFHPNERYKDYINGIGVFCHEFSHAMGLPDIYPTRTSGYVNNQSMEAWDVMDVGLYNYNGFAPSLYLAWEQELMGWTEIETLTKSQSDINLVPLEQGGKAYKMQNAENQNECIILENIQQSGANYKARGHGMLVYHVAYPSNKVNMGDSPNNTAGHPAVAVVPADSILISSFLREAYADKYGGHYTDQEYRNSFAGDPFPGTSAVTSLTDDMLLPNYCFYTEAGITGYSLKNITENTESGVVSFDFEPNAPSAIDEVRGQRSEVRGEYFNLQGQRVANPTHGIYINNGRKVVIGR